MRLGRQVLVVLMALACVPAARADQVGDDIAKASAAWQAHDRNGTLAALDAAAGVLRQQRADALKALLPVALPGWTADPATTSAVAPDMLGGGISATRTYHNGSEQVDVEITTDRPMLQNMAALLASPYASSAGVKNVTVDGHSIAYTQRDNSFMTLIANKVIVRVKGSKDTPEADVQTFVAAVDFSAAAKLAQ